MKEGQPGWFGQNGLLTKVVDVAGKYSILKEGQSGWCGQNGLLTKVGVAGKYLEGKTARMVCCWFGEKNKKSESHF